MVSVHNGTSAVKSLRGSTIRYLCLNDEPLSLRVSGYVALHPFRTQNWRRQCSLRTMSRKADQLATVSFVSARNAF